MGFFTCRSQEPEPPGKATEVSAPPPPPPALTYDDYFRIAATDDRGSVARDEGAPPDILRRLASDAAWGIRSVVAANPSTPPDALVRLAHDEVQGADAIVARNPSAPSALLADLGRANPRREWVRELVAVHPNTPTDVLTELCEQGETLQLAVLVNPSCPVALLRKLEVDPTVTVRVLDRIRRRISSET